MSRISCIDCGMGVLPGMMKRHQGSQNCRIRAAQNEMPMAREL